MNIYIGNKELKELYIGGSKIKEAYLEKQLVRPSRRTLNFSYDVRGKTESQLKAVGLYPTHTANRGGYGIDSNGFYNNGFTVGWMYYKLPDKLTKDHKIKLSRTGTLSSTSSYAGWSQAGLCRTSTFDNTSTVSKDNDSISAGCRGGSLDGSYKGYISYNASRTRLLTGGSYASGEYSAEHSIDLSSGAVKLQQFTPSGVANTYTNTLNSTQINQVLEIGNYVVFAVSAYSSGFNNHISTVNIQIS